METKEISEKKIQPCEVCGEIVVSRVSPKGRQFFATVYQDGWKLVVIVKNGMEVEHRHV